MALATPEENERALAVPGRALSLVEEADYAESLFDDLDF